MPQALFEAKRTLLRELEGDALDWPLIKEYGSELFRALIHPGSEVEKLWRLRNTQEIRFLLHCEQDDLANIPWELAFDLSSKTFVALTCHFLRYFRVPLKSKPHALGKRLVVLASNPYGDLEIDQEIDACSGRWQTLFTDVSVLRDTPLRETCSEIVRCQPSVFHYAGHSSLEPDDYGNVEGALHLVCEDHSKPTEFLRANWLAALLRQAQTSIAFFNSCLAGQYQGDSLLKSVVAAGIQNVVAMNQPVVDEAAIMFSESFYSSLSAGRSLEQALTQSRIRVNCQLSYPSIRWGLPVATFDRPDLKITGLPDDHFE